MIVSRLYGFLTRTYFKREEHTANWATKCDSNASSGASAKYLSSLGSISFVLSEEARYHVACTNRIVNAWSFLSHGQTRRNSQR